MQIKTTFRFHFTPVTMVKMKKMAVDHGEGRRKYLLSAGGNAIWYRHCENQFEGNPQKG